MSDSKNPLLFSVVVVGAAGHGRVVLDILRGQGMRNILGWIDDASDLKGSAIDGLPVLGTIDDLVRTRDQHGRIGGVVAIGDNQLRRCCTERILKLIPDFEFVSAVHPSAQIAASAVIEPGSVVAAGAVVNPGARLRRGSILNTRAALDHDSVLEAFASLGPGAVTGGNVCVGEGSAVGLGAVISNGITIGRDTVIGAGAVVMKDVPDGVVAYGVPARIIRSRKQGEPYLTAHLKGGRVSSS